MNFEIAGIHFVVSKKNLAIGHEFVPAYLPFLKSVYENIESADISVDYQYGCLPNLTALTKIFDAGPHAWGMFWDGREYYFKCDVQTYEKAPWVAQISQDFTNVTVHYGDEFLSHTGNETVLSSHWLHHPLDQILLMHVLGKKAGAVVHAAALDIYGKGYIVPGKSGTGKSTLSQQFLARNVGRILSDDRIVLRKEEKTFTVYGTPWTGESGIAVNASVALGGIFFISHGTTNQLREIMAKEALNQLLPTVSIPWYDREVVPQMLQFCEDLLSTVPMYELVCTPSPEVVDVITDFISK